MTLAMVKKVKSQLPCIKCLRMPGILFGAIIFFTTVSPLKVYSQLYFTTDPVWESAGQNNTVCNALGDVDGDGDLDVVFGNFLESNSLYLNEGGVYSTSPVWSSAPAYGTWSIALGDVDGDGDLDLVCGNFGSSTPFPSVYHKNTLYLNEDGVFSSTPAWSSGTAYGTRSVALGDVDGDGDLDLVCGNDGQSNTLYLNDGGMLSTTPAWSSDSTYNTKCVALGDVDGDGDLDLVCGNHVSSPPAGQSNTLYLNEGGVFSTTPAWSSATAYNTESVALGDVDGDGDLDLTCGNFGQRNPLYLNDGGIFSATPVWMSGSINSTYSIALGDVDADGDLDLVCGNSGGNNTMYINGGTGFLTDPVWSSIPANWTGGVALGDVNGDGALDLVCGNWIGNNTLYTFEGSLLSVATGWSSGPANTTSSVALGDVDGDEDLDLVCGNDGQANTLYLNDGSVFSTTPSWSSSPVLPTRGVALGDVDGDGDLDFACGNNGQANTLYLNDGGVFSTSPVWSSGPANETYALTMGDVDGDGDLDLVCGNLWSITLYLNNGSIFSTNPDWSLAQLGWTISMALGDINGDGDLDLVCGNTEEDKLYLNEGGVFSTTAAWSSGVSSNTRGVALGDVDGDRDLDLVCGITPWLSNTLYLNEDSIFSSTPIWSSGPAEYTWSIALGDVDADGDLDLISGNQNEPNSLYINDGGIFSTNPIWASGASNWTSGVAIGDVDEDGDFDLVCGNEGSGGLVNTLYPGLSAPVFKGDPFAPNHQLPNNAAFLKSVEVQQYSTNICMINFAAFDVESDPIWILSEYQYKGDPTWYPLDVLGQSGNKVGPFSTSPGGVGNSFDWDFTRLAFDDRDVVLRLKVISVPRRVSLIQHVASYMKEVGAIEPLRPELLTSVATLPFDSALTVGDTASADFIIRNSGTALLSISDIILPSSEMRIDKAAPFDLVPGEQDTVTLFLEPQYDLDMSGDIQVLSNDPITPTKTIFVSTDIRALVIGTRLLSPLPEVPLGEALTVIVTPAPEVHIEKGFLYHRPALAASAFQDSIELSPSAKDFIAVIPGVHVMEGGLDYYIKVENNPAYETDPPGAPDDSVFFQAVESPATISSTPIPNEGPDYLEGRDIRVQVSLPVGAIFQEGSLHFRQGGEETGDSTSLQLGDPLPFAMIPDTLVGARGVEYWVKVVTLTDTLFDPPSRPEHSPRTIRVLVQDLKEAKTHSAGQYRMMSIPLAMEGTINGALTDDIGGQDKTRWRMFAYDAKDSGYVEVPNDTIYSFEQGRGYWLITKDPHRLDTGPARGRTTPTDSFFAVTLHPGWNMIGDPFAFAVAWDSCVVDTLTMASAEGTVVEPPVRWMGSSYQYDIGTLEPFEGYWVKSLSDTIVTLKLPPREDPAVSAEPAPIILTGSPDGDWQIEVRASSCGFVDGHNAIGIVKGAATEWDKNDRSEPPLSPGRAISLYFPHVSWKKHPDNYTVDIRGEYVGLDKALTALASEDGDLWGHIWHFDVAKSFSDGQAGDEVTLEFQGIQGAPTSAKLYLIDRCLQHTINLREESHYTFFQNKKAFISKETDARFVLLVGSEDFVESKRDQLPELPAETALYQNYPNPFNPSTVIRYAIAHAGNVAIKIYDVRGSLVKSLVMTYKDPGRYEVGWDGDNESGQRVSSGIYFYMMETSSGFRATRKMLLLK